MTYTVLRKSTPASPRRDVRMSPTWRLAWVKLSLERAEELVAQQPSWQRANYMVVPAARASDYL